MLITRGEWLKQPALDSDDPRSDITQGGPARWGQDQKVLSAIRDTAMAAEPAVALQSRHDIRGGGLVQCCQPSRRALVNAPLAAKHAQQTVLRASEVPVELRTPQRSVYLLCPADQMADHGSEREQLNRRHRLARSIR